MKLFVFTPSDYNAETKTITLPGPHANWREPAGLLGAPDEPVMVLSKASGLKKIFSYDKEATANEYEVNEAWDGEQNLTIYVNHQTGTTLRVWDTPYDNWEI